MPCTDVRVLASGSKSTPASFTLSTCATRVQLNVVSLVSSSVPRGNNMAKIVLLSMLIDRGFSLYELHSTQLPLHFSRCRSKATEQSAARLLPCQENGSKSRTRKF